MPGPIELCVWPSLWMFSRARDTQHTASLAEAEADFNVGYLISLITAVLFVLLGAYTMYGTGEGMLSGSGLSFAKNLIRLYTEAMGGWAAWVIIPAAFAAMFSTTITCLDAYPRSIAAIQGLWQGDPTPEALQAQQRRRFSLWVVIHLMVAIGALIWARSGGITVPQFVFGAMTGSFLTAPVFAWMAMDTINHDPVPPEHRYGLGMRALSWIGLGFLSGFSLLFIANAFFGLGG